MKPLIHLIVLFVVIFAFAGASQAQAVKPGTPVLVENVAALSSRTATVGQAVEFRVVEAIVVNGRVVIPVGATVWGKVTVASRKALVKSGKLEFSIDRVKTADGSYIQLAGQSAMVGQRKLVVLGGETEVPAGTKFTATIGDSASFGSTPTADPSSSAISPPPSSAVSASPSGSELQKPTSAKAGQIGKFKDGEAAIFRTALSPADAMARIKAYFDGKNIDYTVNADSGRVNSNWYNERGCGPGIQRCANKASVRITAEEGQTVIQVQVFERKREAGLSPKPWNENSTSKAKETGELATALETILGGK